MIAGTYRAERKPLGYRQHTVGNTAIGLADISGGVPQGASYAKIVVETNAVRWRDDGTAATSSVGMLQSASTNNEFELVSPEQIRQLSIIRNSSDSVISVAYYGAKQAY